MESLFKFAAVEFPDDPNVAGRTYWYLCPDAAEAGFKVSAPLGRHNNVQQGIIRKVIYADEFSAPFPMYAIKSIVKIETPDPENLA